MQLFYWPSPHGNFGDDLNTWFWDDVLPGWREWDDSVSLIGIGSLMTSNLQLPGGRKVVVGAGAGYGQPPELGPDWDVRFVRGPRTAAALDLPASAGITDTAALCARLPRFAGLAGSGRRPLLVPHWMSDLHPNYDWPRDGGGGGRRLCLPAGRRRGGHRRDRRGAAGPRRVASRGSHRRCVPGPVASGAKRRGRLQPLQVARLDGQPGGPLRGHRPLCPAYPASAARAAFLAPGAGAASARNATLR